MNYKILENGDLLLTADNWDRATLTEAFLEDGYYGAEQVVAEGYHERLYFIRPEAIGALTDSPILTDGADYSDEAMEHDGPLPYADAAVWWFPNYMVQDPWRELASKGRVVFTRAQDCAAAA